MPEILITSQIDYYFGLVKKKRWLLIIPFCLAMSAGIFLAFILPPIYEANTMILVEPQRVPKNYVQSVVTQDIGSRISSISQQILSRTNLENIIKEFHLFSGPEHEELFLEDKLKNLRERININVSKGQSGHDTFSISFRGREPNVTMKVTNTLASFFINENLKVRESQASGTSSFLQDELVSTRKRLQKIEETLQDYRKKHQGELPEELQSNLAIFTRLQAQLIEKQKNLRETKAMLRSNEQLISEMPPSLINDPPSTTQSDSELEYRNSGHSGQMVELKEELVNLRSRYTERHPDVIRLKNNIAQLEMQTGKESEIGSERRAASPKIGLQDRRKMQQNEIRRDIRQQEADIAEMTRQINLYKQRIENTPKREQELFSLNRDYGNIKRSYDSLLQRKLEAEIAVNMEKKQKGEQFRIIDYAIAPQKPISPDMKVLFLLSVAVGLGIGCGLIYLQDLLNTSLKQPRDYETELGLTVLATIPKLVSPGVKMWRQINGALTYCSLVVAVGLTGVFGLLILKGVDPMLEIAKQYIKI
jgi:polysaccharide chain length determinant protein (PEP-CTERM system associated)